MKHALVTAGGKGIGLKVVRDLLDSGYSVSASYRTFYPVFETLREKYGDKIQWIPCDITKKDELLKFVTLATETYGRVDVFIHNAGPYVFERKKLVDYTEDEYYEILNGNVTSLFYLLRKIIPIMRQQKYGRIITYGYQGVNGAAGWMYRSVFAASKSAVASLTKTIAFEEAEHGITANMICPGDIVGEHKEMDIDEVKMQITNPARVGRPGSGEDISRMILFLCDEKSDFITGATIDVNGGMDVVNRYLHVPPLMR